MINSTGLADKVAIVTGGSRGIGLAIASTLVEHGASVMIGGRDEARLEAARSELARRGDEAERRVDARRVDVRDADEVQALVDATVERFGGLDILVNNAGVGGFTPIADMSLDEWHAVLETNLNGVFYGCRSGIPALRRRGGGWIVNISSLAGKNAFPGGGAYCASKSALNAFSEVLMQEIRYDDIRVSYVMPGSVATDFSGRASDDGWKLDGLDVARVVLDLVSHDVRSLPSRVELRPSKPKRR